MNVSSFGVDENNELYICVFDGKIYRLPSPSCAFKGDANGDCAVNVLDVLMVVNITLEIADPTQEQAWAADCNGPLNNCEGGGQFDVLDALKIVNLILDFDECP